MSGTPRSDPIVTIDGPAGSGKSTTAREVARRLGFRHLDSGALYRALTFALLESGCPPETWPQLTENDFGALGLDVTLTHGGVDLRLGGRTLDAELRSEQVTAQVSPLARLPAVRASLLGLQRAAGREGRLVADGRDMGTVVFPDAEVKIFLRADLRERARRRILERTGRSAARPRRSPPGTSGTANGRCPRCAAPTTPWTWTPRGSPSRSRSAPWWTSCAPARELRPSRLRPGDPRGGGTRTLTVPHAPDSLAGLGTMA